MWGWGDGTAKSACPSWKSNKGGGERGEEGCRERGRCGEGGEEGREGGREEKRRGEGGR